MTYSDLGGGWGRGVEERDGGGYALMIYKILQIYCNQIIRPTTKTYARFQFYKKQVIMTFLVKCITMKFKVLSWFKTFERLNFGTDRNMTKLWVSRIWVVECRYWWILRLFCTYRSKDMNLPRIESWWKVDHGDLFYMHNEKKGWCQIWSFF